ncbi:MAG: 1-deoxy-D-xylulose-5-phosphate reductoisomerase [Chloroflexi bacterium]|nr:1-deoxy-D-xylulose-5-phosphate reductoisomerase [Chloroflexota bacterium]
MTSGKARSAANPRKRLAILGSTGSIGRQTLEVARAFPSRLKVEALAGGENKELLLEQLAEFRPALVASLVPLGEGELAHPCLWLSLEEMTTHPDVDLVVVATAGKAGLAPTLAALRAGKEVALANKEVLVMAGEIVMAQAQAQDVTIRPIDSEHSALWQCLEGQRGEVARLILTASGGALRDLSPEQMEEVTPAQALRHPTWSMGRKVTIDSATLMNKGMELIEAHWLFGVPLERIGVVLHPQSMVHSMVEFADGSILAQMSPPDMRLPIQYALSYPERWENPSLPRLPDQATLDFRPVPPGRYPCLELAREAALLGGTCPAVLCAADEVAVERFLAGGLAFTDIPQLIAAALGRHRRVGHPSLKQILAADAWSRRQAQAWSPRGDS